MLKTEYFDSESEYKDWFIKNAHMIKEVKHLSVSIAKAAIYSSGYNDSTLIIIIYTEKPDESEIEEEF